MVAQGKSHWTPPTRGVVFKRASGKLFNFSPGQIMVFSRPWPAPCAWRKTPARAWHRRRPQLTVPAGDLAPEMRRLQSDKDGQLLLRYAIEWQNREPLAWLQFFDQIPRDVREQIAPFKNRHFHLLSFAGRCGAGAIDLIDSNPALAYMCASNWVFRKPAVQKPLRAARSLLRRNQRAMSAWLGLPADESTRKILCKCSHPFGIPELLYLRDALSGPEAKPVSKLLAHAQRINASVLRLATDATLRPFASPNLLSEVCTDANNDQHPLAAWMLRDTLHIAQLTDARVPLIRNLAHLQAIHDTLVEKYNNHDFSKAVNLSFPRPPLSGSDLIEPLTDRQQLIEWAQSEHNCIASYATQVLAGQLYFYRLRIPRGSREERCTLSLVKPWKKKRWVLGELAGTCNRRPSKLAAAAVAEWIRSTRRKRKT